ncbi:hypothetical protein E4U02_14870 [Microbacterium paludicola]|uniref:AlgX/AlgJ SGNH hydrolase-like domain-containing protein n=1 Tax=Microbacterium paludicola TaxID=300019 RepID=A0A4Y9FM45_9MICO|nr:hypothetical protein [Microbacterium paludicola]MBF0817687.1 hypothetical protein [Microbacterium paludicola]TFU30274.1 hypothetical protein E4U02_14870 [Microbacterium paludicola]
MSEERRSSPRPLLADLSADRKTLTVTGLPDGVVASDIRSLGKDPIIEVDDAAHTATITLKQGLGPWALLGGPFQANLRGQRLPVGDELRDRERARVLSLQGPPVPVVGFQNERANAAHTGDAFSALTVPVGSRSADDVVVVGQGGHLFVARGSNALEQQYVPPATRAESAKLRERAARWASLMRARHDAVRSLGSQFVQMVQPEKSSMLDTGLVGLGGRPTPLLVELEKRVASKRWYVSGREVIDRGTRTRLGVEENWIPFDSHPSPLGMWRLARALVERFADASPLDSVQFTTTTTHAGDLSGKIFGHWIRQPIVTSTAPWLDNGAPRLIESGTTRPAHKFVGTKMVWRNPQAPVPLKVVLFGASTFSSTPRIHRTGNRLFSHLFGEYHFRWEPDIDLDYVEAVKPDVVICHTVERFLPRLPER